VQSSVEHLPNICTTSPNSPTTFQSPGVSGLSDAWMSHQTQVVHVLRLSLRSTPLLPIPILRRLHLQLEWASTPKRINQSQAHVGTSIPPHHVSKSIGGLLRAGTPSCGGTERQCQCGVAGSIMPSLLSVLAHARQVVLLDTSGHSEQKE
jgi:hypothetical protein